MINMAGARCAVIAALALTNACTGMRGNTDQETKTQVTAAEDAWVAALRTSDTTTLKALLDSAFTFGTGDPGRPPVERSAWLGNILFGNIRTDSIGYRELAVRPVTPDSAVATLWLHWKPILGGRVANTDITQVEDTWVKRGVGWQVIRRQVLHRERTPL